MTTPPPSGSRNRNPSPPARSGNSIFAWGRGIAQRFQRRANPSARDREIARLAEGWESAGRNIAESYNSLPQWRQGTEAEGLAAGGLDRGSVSSPSPSPRSSTPPSPERWTDRIRAWRQTVQRRLNPSAKDRDIARSGQRWVANAARSAAISAALPAIESDGWGERTVAAVNARGDVAHQSIVRTGGSGIVEVFDDMTVSDDMTESQRIARKWRQSSGSLPDSPDVTDDSDIDMSVANGKRTLYEIGHPNLSDISEKSEDHTSLDAHSAYRTGRPAHGADSSVGDFSLGYFPWEGDSYISVDDPLWEGRKEKELPPLPSETNVSDIGSERFSSGETDRLRGFSEASPGFNVTSNAFDDASSSFSEASSTSFNVGEIESESERSISGETDRLDDRRRLSGIPFSVSDITVSDASSSSFAENSVIKSSSADMSFLEHPSFSDLPLPGRDENDRFGNDSVDMSVLEHPSLSDASSLGDFNWERASHISSVDHSLGEGTGDTSDYLRRDSDSFTLSSVTESSVTESSVKSTGDEIGHLPDFGFTPSASRWYEDTVAAVNAAGDRAADRTVDERRASAQRNLERLHSRAEQNHESDHGRD